MCSFANGHHAADVCEQLRVCLGKQCLLTADHPRIGHPRGGGYHGRWRADSSHFCHLLHGGYKCQLPRRQQEYALKAAACPAAIAAAECLPSNVHVSVVLLSLHGRSRYKQLSVILTVPVRLYGCDQPSALHHLFDFGLRSVADRVFRAFWHLFVCSNIQRSCASSWIFQTMSLRPLLPYPWVQYQWSRDSS